MQLDSIQALLAGGIAFDTLGSTTQEEQARAGATFPLFENQASADEARYNIRLKYLVYFDSSVGGLAPGSNVEWHGLKIGRVVDVKLQYDVTRNVLRAPVLIEIEPERAQLIGVSGSADPAGALKTAVSRGLRAQLKTSNYLTGQSVVALELDPNAKKENLGTGDLYPVIPTDPNEFDSTLRSVNGILDRISKLPFDAVIGQTEMTLKSLQELADAPEIKQSLNMLAATLKSTSDLINQSKADLEPALREVKPTLVSAEKAMKRIEKSLDSFEQGYGKSSSFKRDIARLFVQINDTMHSMQMIADYLEQHPESLIRGKPSGTK
ncbi:MlaD family protein [Brucella intermedia]|uniref:MlaD family protein n=1 Tax=Brucella intermedia TaxID=94625 RepID=UPI00235E7266|nr:MlaD family protein [Brucella intermedia]